MLTYFEYKSTFSVEESRMQEDLASIRSMMERSSKFISFSGLAGILAGVYALIGAGLAYSIVKQHQEFNYSGNVTAHEYLSQGTYHIDTILKLALIALVVLVVSLFTGYILSKQKAHKQGQVFWSKASKLTMLNMAVPLVTGGLLIVIFASRGYLGIVAPACLVFYGLGLFGASINSYDDLKYLGLCQIVLGIIAAALPGYGLFFWALGFGILHIVYGTVMYRKYDR